LECQSEVWWIAEPYVKICLPVLVALQILNIHNIPVESEVFNVCSGQPTIRGKRITVQTILEFLSAGENHEEVY